MKHLPIILLFVLGVRGAAGDISPPPRKTDSVVRDGEGRVVGLIREDGYQVLISYDSNGRLTEVRGEKTCPADGQLIESQVLTTDWVHRFAYESSSLARELDCVGIEHLLPPESRVDLRTGSALKGHGHPIPPNKIHDKGNAR